MVCEMCMCGVRDVHVWCARCAYVVCELCMCGVCGGVYGA